MHPLAPTLLTVSCTPQDDQSVVDVGCGTGELVEAWRAAGVYDSRGMDVSPAAAAAWPEGLAPLFYTIVDAASPEARQAMPVTNLVTSFEAAQQVPKRDAAAFVSLLTMFRPRFVVFGAATPNQARGKNRAHVNENDILFWIRMFKEEVRLRTL